MPENAFIRAVGEWLGEYGIATAVCVLILGGIMAAAWADVESDERAAAEFMAECQQDKKHYECQALWRAGQQHTTVVPVPVVISK